MIERTSAVQQFLMCHKIHCSAQAGLSKKALICFCTIFLINEIHIKSSVEACFVLIFLCEWKLALFQMVTICVSAVSVLKLLVKVNQ